jgi:hypothetical protein
LQTVSREKTAPLFFWQMTVAALASPPVASIARPSTTPLVTTTTALLGITKIPLPGL